MDSRFDAALSIAVILPDPAAERRGRPGGDSLIISPIREGSRSGADRATRRHQPQWSLLPGATPAGAVLATSGPADVVAARTAPHLAAAAPAPLVLDNPGFEDGYTAQNECANSTGFIAGGWADNTCWDATRPVIRYERDVAIRIPVARPRKSRW